MARTKYVTIESSGKIHALGGLVGPITTPCYLDIGIIISLINSGIVVYEVNPSNIKDKTRLNRMNVLNNIYTYKTNNTLKTSTTIKVSNVGISSVASERDSIISSEPDKGLTGVDMFLSNKNF